MSGTCARGQCVSEKSVDVEIAQIIKAQVMNRFFFLKQWTLSKDQYFFSFFFRYAEAKRLGEKVNSSRQKISKSSSEQFSVQANVGHMIVLLLTL